jgi:hypothetical protein
VFETKKEADNALFENIEGYYNNRRLQSSLGYLTPEGFEIKYKTLLASTNVASDNTEADTGFRAMRGRNASAGSASKPEGSAAERQPAGQSLRQESKRKIPEGPGDNVPHPTSSRTKPNKQN